MRTIRIRRSRWRTLVRELDRRGRRHRESGAFLLGRRRRCWSTVTAVVYFDDLDPDSLNGAVHLSHQAFSNLWCRCRTDQVDVLADVHTHPGRHVGQSKIDRDNPLVARAGHVAMIVPNFAAGSIALSDVGVHVYHGDDGWRDGRRVVRHGWFR